MEDMAKINLIEHGEPEGIIDKAGIGETEGKAGTGDTRENIGTGESIDQTGDKNGTGENGDQTEARETGDQTGTGENKDQACGKISCCHYKSTPRQEKELRQLRNRINRMTGQLNGIGRMLDENRYCGDILTQIAAVESALEAFGHAVLKEHLETCVVEEIRKGNLEVMDEAVELIRKLK